MHKLKPTYVVIALLALITTLLLLKAKMSEQKNSQQHSFTLNIDAFASLPDRLDTAYVRTAGQYRILLHLVRALTKYNKQAQLEADIARSWSITDDFKTYKFEIDPSAKWSDGTTITADEVAQSIRRQKRLNTATHFDFNDIATIENDNHSIEIKLKRRNPHFLNTVAHPEFGTVKHAQKDRLEFSDLKTTSGAYVLADASMTSYRLIANKFHPAISEKSPLELTFRSTALSNQIASLEKNEVQFVVPSAPVSLELHNRLKAEPDLQAFVPHVGYSYWFSLNPKSAVFRDESKRFWFADFIHRANLDFSTLSNFWQRADQIYLPDGYGRPSPGQIQSAWALVKFKASKSPPAKLVIVVSNSFYWTDQITHLLAAAHVETIIKKFTSAEEFEAILLNHNYDAILVNNDFSDAHLVENLLITFNKSRPLILAGDNHKFYDDLEKAVQSDDDETQFKISREIGIGLIEQGYIAPIAYNRKSFYAQKNLDLSEWTELQSDLCFWKVRER